MAEHDLLLQLNSKLGDLCTAQGNIATRIDGIASDISELAEWKKSVCNELDTVKQSLLTMKIEKNRDKYYIAAIVGLITFACTILGGLFALYRLSSGVIT